jgi:hypothetical protein
MASPYASGKKAFGFCDRCGFRTKLPQLRDQIVKQRPTGLLVCPVCYDIDNPQLMLGTFPVYDPIALRNPRPDTSYYQSGVFAEGSRVIQWNWAPVGGFNTALDPLTPDTMLMTGAVGTVTVTIT